MDPSDEALLIAPCGMNCGFCIAHLREKNRCPGCRIESSNKPITRIRCKIKTCEKFKTGKIKFCFECDDFPCENLIHLDDRYRKKYRMSMIKNLKDIKEHGLEKFIKNQKIKWSCGHCGGVVCIHNNFCISCGKENIVLLKNK